MPHEQLVMAYIEPYMSKHQNLIISTDIKSTHSYTELLPLLSNKHIHFINSSIYPTLPEK